MKAKLLFATLLMSGICIAQSNPTIFTNNNQPRPSPQSTSYTFDIVTENSQPVGKCPPNSAGCILYFAANPSTISITLPDIQDQYKNHDTLLCAVKSATYTGTYGCQAAKCQSVTYIASDSGTDTCTDSNGQVWTLTTTQYYHWQHIGRRDLQVYDGGHGTVSH